MKDSRIGTYGVLALVLGALLKVALLAPLMEGDLLPLALIVVAVHSLSRSSMPVLMAYTAPAKTSGVASKAGKVTVSNAGLGLGLSLLFIWISLGFGPALWASVLCFVVLTIWAWISQRQVGGHTGDTLGALQQIIEIALLALFTSYLGS